MGPRFRPRSAEVYNQKAADKMGIGEPGTVCVMIHSGSRGLGHQVATDALVKMERCDVKTNDRQLACRLVIASKSVLLTLCRV